MKRANERRPYSLGRYRNVPMDHVVALLSQADEDYFGDFQSRTRNRRQPR